MEPNRPWLDTLMLPAYAGLLSVILFTFHTCISSPARSRIHNDSVHNWRVRRVIRAFDVLRTLGCVGLIYLSVLSHWHYKLPVNGLILSKQLLSLTFLYTFLLSLSSLRSAHRNTTDYHANTLLCIVFAVYFYRDVFPLFTFLKAPQDSSEGWIIWAKVAVLSFVVILPLLKPRPYVPVNPDAPMKSPNPEQTASRGSLISYSFLNRTVLSAYFSPQLTHDQLPPLADSDDAQHLKEKGFLYLDPFLDAKSRHIFFGLMRIFRVEYATLAMMSLITIAAEFASPIGINRLLNYIETDGNGALMRPWFWIIWLFFGPVVHSLAKQFYEFIATRTQVQAESLLTQLIFEHSLRIRPKDDVHGSSGATGESAQEDSNPNMVGKLNNLVTTDLANIMAAKDFLQLFVQVPIQIVLCVAFLYVILGWSAFVGLAIIMLSFPVPGLVGKRVHAVQTKLLKKTDARVTQVIEALNMIRMIKLFGWEQKMSEKIHEKREEELKWVWIREWLDLINKIIKGLYDPDFYSPCDILYITLIMKQELSASKVFSTMTVIDMFRQQLYVIFGAITSTITGKVSLDRIDDFLHNTELLDEYSDTPLSHRASLHRDCIGFNNATFSWSGNGAGTLTPSGRNFSLQIEEQLIFKRGGFNIIVGPTGSGKTSLLMALLGEMHFVPRGPDSWFSLPRAQGVGYAAQMSWIQNDTIKANILFGSAFDAERYRQVVHQCALEHDLKLFDAGDLTEVGETGTTLSGGQRARITLARAVYSAAEILLLDDILAALDVHTAKWIVDKCFSGELLRDRTVLLVTHNVALASSVADYVVSVGLDGRVVGEESVRKAISKDSFLLSELQKDEEALQKSAEEVDAAAAPQKAPPSGTLIVAEEKEEGHVNWSAIKMYFNGLAGDLRILFHTCFIVTMMISNVSINLQTYYLGFWASQYDDRPASEVPVYYHIAVFTFIVFMSVFWHIICQIVFIKGALRASRSIHRQLMTSVLGTTLRWLDVTPISRVITRSTQDISVVDGPLWDQLFGLWNLVSFMLIKFGVVVVLSPIFFVPGVLLVVVGGALSQVYMSAQLSVKREMATARAPVLASFGASVAGLTSIRAYGAQHLFKESLLARINHYSRAARTFYNLSRWISLRLDLLSALFASALAVYLLYFQSYNAATTGFSLNMGVGFSMLTLYLVQILNAFEVQSNSVERIRQYVEIEQERSSSEEVAPPAYWPASGQLDVENLSARYSTDGHRVLHNLSFSVKSGERIGVVGRTGSGKSSLTLSLLRAIPTDGEIVYDGIPTSQIELLQLRSNVTIIPQIPELLSGTLRYNLDPFNQWDDATLNNALHSSGLHSLQSDTDDNRLTLDTSIASGGSNLSVGQRQILALARAIVRGSKLLILDEATSAIDHKTDEVIQSSLRRELDKDVTLILVAHRLHTVMDADRIMVLEDGRIAEFDTPKVLLEREKGKLRELVDQSEDKGTLYEMAMR